MIRIMLIVALACSFNFTPPAISGAKARTLQNYCHNRAQQLSGYRGRVGGALGGAVGGAIGGAVITGILGGNKRARRNAARIGALLGGIAGANRANGRAARIYRLEYQACMRRR